MNEDHKRLEFQQDPGDEDEVEILEVVGMDEERSSDPIPAGPEEELVDFPKGPEGRGGAPPKVVEEDRYLRLQADYLNLQKRLERERRDFESLATSTLVKQLLPVMDNFELALAAGDEPNGSGALRDGLVMIYRQLGGVLEREGLTAIETVGRPFDPKLHDAVEADAESDQPANTILSELRRGYLFRNRLLRPALVKVSTNGSLLGHADVTFEEG